MQSDLQALDFDVVRRLLERLAFSPYGACAARELVPAPTVTEARMMQASVTAARRAVDAGESPRVSSPVPDVRAALRQALQPGAALSAQALHHIRQVMRLAEELARFAARHPGLCPQPQRLNAASALVDLLDARLSNAGRLREDATQKLVELHGRHRALRAEVEEFLRRRAAAPDLRDAAAEPQVHWHGGRGMLSVHPGKADSVKGVRRGSGTGGTSVYVEPLEAVAANNRLVTVWGQIETEHHVVLRETTDAVREHGPVLEQMLGALTWTDLALAAGRASAAMNASPPALTDQPGVTLDRAYHPLLLLQFVENQIPMLRPVSLALQGEAPMMLITGPNTGGKTVVLKTVGLLATMAHCGLHLPSEGDCAVGSFARAIVDVGDRQSLHHRLSTFAGHVEALKKLLAEADAETLVLLDELGTGTDPEEGAALAMAVLDELVARRVHGIVTTHLSPLKGYAAAHAGIVNASMRFDFETLGPTYELEIGKPGESLGLLVAERNGLPAELLARARAHLKDLARR